MDRRSFLLTAGAAGMTATEACGAPAKTPGMFGAVADGRTDNTAPLAADPVRNRQILERIPAARWGEPSDLAGAAVFLSSRASDYVNGHVLVVDGGWMGR